jgi:hypothetical protein
MQCPLHLFIVSCSLRGHCGACAWGTRASPGGPCLDCFPGRRRLLALCCWAVWPSRRPFAAARGCSSVEVFLVFPNLTIVRSRFLAAAHSAFLDWRGTRRESSLCGVLGPRGSRCGRTFGLRRHGRVAAASGCGGPRWPAVIISMRAVFPSGTLRACGGCPVCDSHLRICF